MKRYEIRITETFVIEAESPEEAEEACHYNTEWPDFSDTQVEELEDEVLEM